MIREYVFVFRHQRHRGWWCWIMKIGLWSYTRWWTLFCHTWTTNLITLKKHIIISDTLISAFSNHRILDHPITALFEDTLPLLNRSLTTFFNDWHRRKTTICVLNLLIKLHLWVMDLRLMLRVRLWWRLCRMLWLRLRLGRFTLCKVDDIHDLINGRIKYTHLLVDTLEVVYLFQLVLGLDGNHPHVKVLWLF